MRDLLLRLQNIDRRWLYMTLAIVVTLCLLFPFSLPLYISPQVKSLYDAVEKVPKDKIVIVASEWDAGTRGENLPQTRVIMEHLMRRGIKFAILSQYQQGPRLAEAVAEELARKYNKVYGVDWCNWGYKIGGGMMLQALSRNIPKTIEKDIRGTPVEKIPMMAGVKDIRDVGLIVVMSGSAVIDSYIAFIRSVYGTPLGFGCTAVMAPEQYPFLDSGQLVGLLAGLMGAAQYEKLLSSPGRAMRAMNAQSMAHLLIIVLIVLGNIGYAMSRGSKR